jgi:aerobic carbon-monoxide dehydrogenase medium subunit
VRTVAAVPQPIEVSVPTSEQEARALFAAASPPLPAGGATIITPELSSGARAASHVMLLHHAGLDGVRREGGRIAIGAAARLSTLREMPEPLHSAIAGVADPEVRAQATLAGNVCAEPLDGAPRGDLQGPLLVLDAVVHWTDGVEDHHDGIEEFLTRASAARLVLGVEFAAPEKGAFAALRRPHSHGYTVLAVSAAMIGGELRLAATGLGPHAVRLGPPEEPLAAGAAAGGRDDALASSWYRREMVPVLVHRCVQQMEGSA